MTFEKQLIETGFDFINEAKEYAEESMAEQCETTIDNMS